jgi:hypothetical protein
VTSARRDSGRRRPRGYIDWRPRPKTVHLIDQVQGVLVEYRDYLPVTVRQLFYRLVGDHGYEKTEKAYKRLDEHLVRARRARLIPFEAIRDDGVVMNAGRWYRDKEDFLDEYAWRAANYRADLQQGQPVRVEPWCEAAGMMPQLARTAHKYCVPVYSNGGFSSLSAVREFVDRALDLDVPLVLLHVGDYDPSGESIFGSMTRDAIAFLRDDRTHPSQDIIPERVALTANQIDTYGLDTEPPKESDSRSGKWDGGTCQLEALAPDQLAEIVESAIIGWLDGSVLKKVVDQERRDRQSLQRALPGGESSH